MTSVSRIRLLFVAENITLAQVTRLATLASSLDERRYEIHFACSDFLPMIFGEKSFRKHFIKSVTAKEALEAMKKGKWIYTKAVLESYIQQDLKLLDEVKPHIVIHDCRLSLAVSATLRRLPLVNLINAYWSPYAERENHPLPEHPLVGLLGPSIASLFFPLARPLVHWQFARPLNLLRQKHGLPEIGTLEEILTYGDYVIYPDVPELVLLKKLPVNHFFIGPVLWSPCRNVAADALLPIEKPVVYATLGSSGAGEKLPLVARALEETDVYALIATAGATHDLPLSAKRSVKEFLPGSFCCKNASVVLCNGGSSTGYQALAEGTPILGIPSNLDQYLCMQILQKAGAGITLRSDSLTVEGIKNALSTLFSNPDYRNKAKKLQSFFSGYDSKILFQEVLSKIEKDRDLCFINQECPDRLTPNCYPSGTL